MLLHNEECRATSIRPDAYILVLIPVVAEGVIPALPGHGIAAGEGGQRVHVVIGTQLHPPPHGVSHHHPEGAPVARHWASWRSGLSPLLHRHPGQGCEFVPLIQQR